MIQAGNLKKKIQQLWASISKYSIALSQETGVSCDKGREGRCEFQRRVALESSIVELLDGKHENACATKRVKNV